MKEIFEVTAIIFQIYEILSLFVPLVEIMSDFLSIDVNSRIFLGHSFL